MLQLQGKIAEQGASEYEMMKRAKQREYMVAKKNLKSPPYICSGCIELVRSMLGHWLGKCVSGEHPAAAWIFFFWHKFRRASSSSRTRSVGARSRLIFFLFLWQNFFQESIQQQLDEKRRREEKARKDKERDMQRVKEEIVRNQQASSQKSAYSRSLLTAYSRSLLT